MKKEIEKVLFHMLLNTPETKAILGHEIAAKFGSMVGGDVNDYFSEIPTLLDELESSGFVHTEVLSNGNFRVSRGIDFYSWSP